MKSQITFDNSAVEFVLKAFGKTINKKGYIRNIRSFCDDKCYCKIYPAECGICKKSIHISNFAGVISGIGLVCNNISCLVAISGVYAISNTVKSTREAVRSLVKNSLNDFQKTIKSFKERKYITLN
jgi:hypothetical protein